MPAPFDAAALRIRLGQIQAQLAAIGEFRPGSLNRRFLRCHKPGCRYAETAHPGHRPYWSLTFESGGKTVTRSIPPQAVERSRQRVAEYQRFRSLTAEFVELSEQLCQAGLAYGDSAEQANKR